MCFRIQKVSGVSVMAQQKRIRLRTMRLLGSIPGLAQWVKDPALLWLWYRPAATAPIRSRAWEPPYATGAALKKKKKKKDKNQTNKKTEFRRFQLERHCICATCAVTLTPSGSVPQIQIPQYFQSKCTKSHPRQDKNKGSLLSVQGRFHV